MHIPTVVAGTALALSLAGTAALAPAQAHAITWPRTK